MKLKALIFAVLTGCLVAACGIYSFSGTSIQPDVKSITIPYVEYKALRVNPSLSGQLTEALQEKFRKLTSLEQVETDGDLELVCEITGYDVKATAVTADEMASQSRLTVTVKVDFTNKKYPEDNVEISPTRNTRKTTWKTSPSAPTRTLTPPLRWIPWRAPSAKPSWIKL